MKLGVICDGISGDLEHSLKVMDEFGLEYAELQFIWEHEIGDHDASQMAKIKALLDQYNKPVSCLSRHIFAGLTTANRPGDIDHTRHMDALKRVMEMAHDLASPSGSDYDLEKGTDFMGAKRGRTMECCQRRMGQLAAPDCPAVELARKEGLTLVVETGNGTMVNSNYTAVKLIDALDARDVLKILWDPANNCWCHEQAWPDGFETARDGYLGHIHIKDVQVDTPKATLEVRPMGKGQLADMFAPIAQGLKELPYDGVISFESVYHPGNGNFEDGFRGSIDVFKAHFS